jgi:hypothetical protein
MLTIAVGSYVCGRFLDSGVSARTLVTATGIIMLIPAALWAWAIRVWSPQPVGARAAAE